MKTFAISVLVLASFSCFFSCKNDAKNKTETPAVVKDSIAEAVPQMLYVTAVSGLTLREQPNLQSAKLTVMPLGSAVELVRTERKTTMNVAGIEGAMDAVAYQDKNGFAFNGFLSQFFPPAQNASSKAYAEKLKEYFPGVVYSETTGGTASKPTKTETLILPTDKWHEAFFTAQQLFEIPHSFAFPNPKGSNNETQQNSQKKKTDFISELQISRQGNALQKIVYSYKTEGFGYTVIITKEGNGMKLEKVEVAD